MIKLKIFFGCLIIPSIIAFEPPQPKKTEAQEWEEWTEEIVHLLKETTEREQNLKEIKEITEKFPEFFKGIPLELRSNFLDNYKKYLRTNEPIMPLLKNIYKPGSEPLIYAHLIVLGNTLGFKKTSMQQSGGYVVFDNGDIGDWPRIVEYDKQKKLLETIKDPLKVQQHKKLLSNTLENILAGYKIHLMPAANVNLMDVVLKIRKVIDSNPGLIKVFKIYAHTYKQKDITEQAEIAPIVVIYAQGKENAQKVLNKIYETFKNVPGLNIQPRYNARVNDLIWVAQGNGNDKSDQYAHYYEQPDRVYYRSDITGTKQNYHLIHPETGKEIV